MTWNMRKLSFSRGPGLHNEHEEARHEGQRGQPGADHRHPRHCTAFRNQDVSFLSLFRVFRLF